jgi:hypothetical protein
MKRHGELAPSRDLWEGASVLLKNCLSAIFDVVLASLESVTATSRIRSSLQDGCVSLEGDASGSSAWSCWIDSQGRALIIAPCPATSEVRAQRRMMFE